MTGAPYSPEEMYRTFECLACGCGSQHDIAGNWARDHNVCNDCVRALANEYVISMSGEADERFMSADDYAEWKRQHPTVEKPKRKNISPGTRTAVLERDAYRCVACGGYEGLEVDHKEPLAKGGPDTMDNYQTLCRPCNIRKGAKSFDEWVESVGASS